MSDDEKENKAEQMRFALSAIANEVQSFQNDTSSSIGSSNPEDIFSALVKCKCALRLKNDEMKVLRRNLKTACSVVKTISTTKDAEIISLKTQLYHVKKLSEDLENQLKEKTKVINTLQKENQTFRVESQCFDNLIQLGYQQLLTIQNELLKEMTLTIDHAPEAHCRMKQLQNIIFYCGRYCAETFNQSIKSARLEQKNRFLTSKLNILEKYLDSTLEKLPSHKFQKESGDSRAKIWSEIGRVRSEYQILEQSSITNLKMMKIHVNKPSLFRNISSLDLTCHLNTVKNLLQDQEALIKDLNCLKEELSLE